VTIPKDGLAFFDAALPSKEAVCGAALYLQVVEFDLGASQMFSFSRGLKLELGG